MGLYSYHKKVSSPQRKMMSYFSYGSIVIGAVFLFWSVYPIISYQIYAQIFLQDQSTDTGGQAGQTGRSDTSRSTFGNDSIFTTNLVDYTKAASWFPTFEDEVQPVQRTFPITHYTLSIPKLGIEDAKVLLGGEDLSSALIHYLPRVMPCEYGKVAIFGHSTHPALAKLKGSNYYKSIFTYLPTISEGDIIILKTGTVTCEYQVFEKYEVMPDQVSVLAQQYDSPYLTLVTCTPPGTYLRRLIVNARLLNLPTDNQY